MAENILSTAYELFSDDLWVNIASFYPQFDVWRLIDTHFLEFSQNNKNIVFKNIHNHNIKSSPEYNRLVVILDQEFPQWFQQQQYEKITNECFHLLPKYKLFLDSSIREDIYYALDKSLPETDSPITYWELEALYHSEMIIEIEPEEQRCNLHRARPMLPDKRVGDDPYADPTEILSSKFGGCADIPREWTEEKGEMFWQEHILIAQFKLSDLFAEISPLYAPRTVPNHGMLFFVHDPVNYYLEMDKYLVFYYPSEDPDDYEMVYPDKRSRSRSKNKYGGYIPGGGNYDCHFVYSFKPSLQINDDVDDCNNFDSKYLPRYHSNGNVNDDYYFPDFEDIAFAAPSRGHWINASNSPVPNPSRLIDGDEASTFFHFESKYQFMWGDDGFLEVSLPKKNQSNNIDSFDVSRFQYSLITS